MFAIKHYFLIYLLLKFTHTIFWGFYGICKQLLTDAQVWQKCNDGKAVIWLVIKAHVIQSWPLLRRYLPIISSSGTAIITTVNIITMVNYTHWTAGGSNAAKIHRTATYSCFVIFQNMSIQHKCKFFNYLWVLPFLQSFKKMKQHFYLILSNK